METATRTKIKEKSHIVMENSECDDSKTAYTIPVMVSEDDSDKFRSSDDGSEFPSRKTQSTKDINLQLRCRLCAHVYMNKCMIHIFDFDAASHNIPSMIHLCLPIMVTEADALPKQVCRHCLEELERCYRFHQAVAKADEQLLVFEGLGSGNLGDWATSPPPDRQHESTGGTLERNSNIEMSNGKSTNGLGERPTADTSATENVLPPSLKPCTAVPSITQNCQENNSSAGKEKNSLTNPEHLNPDSTTEVKFDIGTTTASHIVQKRTSDSEVISATCSRSEADAKPEKQAEHADPAIQVRSDARKQRHRCTTCGKEFNQRRFLTRHKVIHSDIRELYGCNSCSKMFKSKQSLRRHQKFHTRGGLYRCKYCPKKFDTAADRKHHHSIHTGGSPSKNHLKADPAVQERSEARKRRYRCTTCGKEFNERNQLTRHSVVHSDIRELYKCNLCSKMFKTKNGLSGHQELHTRGRLYSCKYCLKKFDTKEERNLHYRDHEGERLYRNNLKVEPAIQIQSDTGKPEYRCTTCSKVLSSKGNLVEHNKIHSDVRELYQCNLCPRMFKSKNGLSGHQESHTRGKL